MPPRYGFRRPAVTRHRHSLPGLHEPIRVVHLTDLHATIMHLMGISPKTAFDVERRPFYVTEDGKGKPVLDIIA